VKGPHSPDFVRAPRARPAFAFATALLLSMSGSACRILPEHPYWIEALGHATGSSVGAWTGGALTIGTDRHLYAYPGQWSRPWLPSGPPQELRAVAASRVAIYGILGDGQVGRLAGELWTAYPGSVAWGTSSLSATDDDRLMVIVGGHVRLVEGVDLKESVCASLPGAVIALAGIKVDEAYVLDEHAVLHHGAGGSCDAVATPKPLQRIAATGGRLVGVAQDGTIWRRRDGAWTALPAPRKFRPGRAAFETRARDVAVSANSTWILDDEGAVFVLSDET
jgi:hypothetical protein